MKEIILKENKKGPVNLKIIFTPASDIGSRYRVHLKHENAFSKAEHSDPVGCFHCDIFCQTEIAAESLFYLFYSDRVSLIHIWRSHHEKEE